MSRGKPYKLRVDTASTQPTAPAKEISGGQEREQSEEEEEQVQGLDSVQNYGFGEDYDLGDGWLSEDEQLFSLLVDDIERESREATFLLERERRRQQQEEEEKEEQQQLRSKYGQSPQGEKAVITGAVTTPSLLLTLPPLEPGTRTGSGAESSGPTISPFSSSLKKQSLRRSITDIEDYYAAGPSPSRAKRPSAAAMRRERHEHSAIKKAVGGECDQTSFISNIQEEGSEATGAQDGRGEEGYFGGPAEVLRVGAECLRVVDAPGSPEGRRRDRERDEVIAKQQVAEFTAVKGQNLPSVNPETVSQTESELFGSQATTNDPTISLLTPQHLRNKSPLGLFRSRPRKTLSVTDLVSLSWCELQYWYTLAYHGRKPPTAAMKLGTAAHQTLEDQVHTTVPVEVMTREDGWALRIWNLIQGLRTLRETGITRELEVWGVVDGELVTGIIDQVATECPDVDKEKEMGKHYKDIRTDRVTVEQKESMSVDEFLMQSAGGQPMSVFEAMMGSKDKEPTEKAEKTPKKRGRKKKETRYYITDIKTRGGKSATVPTLSSTGFKPTSLQLQLYYHILTRLVTTDDVTIENIADRHRLDINLPFSDSFIAQVSNIQQPEFSSQKKRKKSRSKKAKAEPATTPSSPGSEVEDALESGDIMDLMLKHNTLKSLWPLVKEQLRLTFLPQPSPSQPQPQATPTTTCNGDNTLISPLVTATYITPHDQEAPDAPLRLLGSRSFVFSPDSLYPYLTSVMRWWRGYRETRGVSVFEAWKCGFCEFRDICPWRRDKEEELAQRAREKMLVKEMEKDSEKKLEGEDVQDEVMKETDTETKGIRRKTD